jgi:two-component system sensor histidine kinase DesK
MSFRPIPRDGYSWTGYVWLLYLATPIWYAASGRGHASLGVPLTGAAIVAFLPLYFWGFWLNGAIALRPIAGIAAIACVLSPFNPGAWTFFVYAASFAGRVGRPPVGIAVLLALLAIVGVETWVLQLPSTVWGPAIPLIVLVGGLGVAFSDIGRTQMRLRRAAEEESRRLAVVAERERIGRDLHDVVGHTLTMITLKADLASKLMSLDPARSLDEVRDIERISRDALAEVRRAVSGYRSATLAEEVERAGRALASAGVEPAFQTAPISLDRPVEHVLALAVREAVTNVVRHARARRCAVRLGDDGTHVHLEIEDDGIGGAATEGTGLSGMRERVAGLGGQMSRDGRTGTRLTITVPASSSRTPGDRPRRRA